jgi:CNT family concentrative nucleoside transporter
MGRFTGVLGIATILGLAYIFSTSRRSIRLKTVVWGLGLQLALGLFVLRVESGEWLFQKMGNGAKKLLDFSYVGSSFVFGELGRDHSSLGLIFAFQVLPTIIFIAAFFAVLYHLGVMQIIIRGAAWLMTVIMMQSTC